MDHESNAKKAQTSLTLCRVLALQAASALLACHLARPVYLTPPAQLAWREIGSWQEVAGVSIENDAQAMIAEGFGGKLSVFEGVQVTSRPVTREEVWDHESLRYVIDHYLYDLRDRAAAKTRDPRSHHIALGTRREPPETVLTLRDVLEYPVDKFLEFIHLFAEAPSGRIVVESDPVHASILLDGLSQDWETNRSFFVRAGTHSVVLTHRWYRKSKRFSVSVKPRTTETIRWAVD